MGGRSKGADKDKGKGKRDRKGKGGRKGKGKERGKGKVGKGKNGNEQQPPPLDPYAAFLQAQASALQQWNTHLVQKKHTLQKVSMSGETQDLVSDLLQEIAGTDSEDILFADDERMASDVASLRHSEEARFLFR
eukprot:SAG31_NODE_1036_length_10221_cov_170.602326_6_plen_134_part_00